MMVVVCRNNFGKFMSCCIGKLFIPLNYLIINDTRKILSIFALPLYNILLLHANRMSMKLRLMVFSVVRSYVIAEGFVRIQICLS